MYLEISGRRSGKTHRLIEAAEKVDGVIVAFNVHWARELSKQTDCKVIVYNGECSVKGYSNLFFDEPFVMMKDVPILHDAYYAGTPPYDPELKVMGKFIEAQPYYVRATTPFLEDVDKKAFAKPDYEAEWLGEYGSYLSSPR